MYVARALCQSECLFRPHRDEVSLYLRHKPEGKAKNLATAYCFASYYPAQAVKVNASIRLYQNESDTQPKSASASDILVSANKKTNLILGSLN